LDEGGKEALREQLESFTQIIKSGLIRTTRKDCLPLAALSSRLSRMRVVSLMLGRSRSHSRSMGLAIGRSQCVTKWVEVGVVSGA